MATHEKNPEQSVEGSWARQERKKARQIDVDREANGEVSEKRIREEENEENETRIVERRCVNSVSAEGF